jgi:hypothetical protein
MQNKKKLILKIFLLDWFRKWVIHMTSNIIQDHEVADHVDQNKSERTHSSCSYVVDRWIEGETTARCSNCFGKDGCLF